MKCCSFPPSSLLLLVHQTSNKPRIFKSYQKICIQQALDGEQIYQSSFNLECQIPCCDIMFISSFFTSASCTSNKPPVFKSYQKSIHVHFTPLVLKALQSNEPPQQLAISWSCHNLEQTQARINESCYHFASLHRS